MRPFVLCIHDATPAYARETRVMQRDLAPLLGRRFSFGVVPNWCGEWPLARDRDYCRFVQESSEELLLHGYFHRRQRGRGPTSVLTDGADEMNGLNVHETRYTVERGQHVFAEVFGAPARGFLAPAWQRGRLRLDIENTNGLQHVVGFFGIESRAGQEIPVSTWTWDCGRWGWLGHVGHGLGWLSQSLSRSVPSLAVHPRDLERGFWHRTLRLIRSLVDAGYEPTTPTALLANDVEIPA